MRSVIDQERVAERVTVLRLNHGPVSAMDTALCEAISAEVGALARRHGTGDEGMALVLTGTGKAFSAGVDLRNMLEGGAPYLDRFLPALSKAFDDLFRYPGPVVAAVNGHAIAGGCVLANCCDYRFMAAGNGRIGIPELLVGVAFPVVPLEIMRFATGGVGLQELAYLGSSLLPDEAVTRHLIDEVVPAGELLERAIARAGQLAAVPAASFRHTKELLRAEAVERIARTAPERDPRMLEIWKSAATRDAVARYVDQTLGPGRDRSVS